MSSKTERIEMRADAESAHRLTEAARAEHVSVSAFILKAAVSAADRVLARSDATIMPAGQFDQLMTSLDEPDEAPALALLAAKARQFRRA